jgi:hypothetical protein
MAAILAYFSSLNNGELDESYHIWFFLFAVAGSVLVAVGILLESDWPISRMKIREIWGITLVILGVVIEASFTFALLTFDEGISRKQEAKIADLDTQLIARTKELLAVRKLTADRSFTGGERKSVIEALSPFSGQQAKIVIFPVNFESSFAANQILTALAAAHWVVDPPEKLFVPPQGMLAQGVLIVPSSDIGSLNAADALFNALKLTGFKGTEASGKQSMPEMNLFDHSKPLVWVFVGDKPTPLLDWIAP